MLSTTDEYRKKKKDLAKAEAVIEEGTTQEQAGSIIVHNAKRQQNHQADMDTLANKTSETISYLTERNKAKKTLRTGDKFSGR